MGWRDRYDNDLYEPDELEREALEDVRADAVEDQGPERGSVMTQADRSITLRGEEAIDYAERHGLTLSKYADPVEGAREDLTLAEARKIAREDAGLLYLRLGLRHTGWGVIGEPADGVLVAGPWGPSLDLTGYSEGAYWSGDEWLGADPYGIVPVYETTNGEQLPLDATPYPYIA